MATRQLFDSDSEDVFEEVGFLMLLEYEGLDPTYFQVPTELLTFMSNIQPDRLNFQAREGDSSSLLYKIAQNLFNDEGDPMFKMVEDEDVDEALVSMIQRSEVVDVVPKEHVYYTLYF